MVLKRIVSDYWFVIDSYVYIVVTKKCALLYNTLDGNIIESNKIEVIGLLKEILQEENYGVVLLKNERYQQKDIYLFICEVREKFMGDILDISLSKCKPVQLMPYFNYPDKRSMYKTRNFTPTKNLLENLSEITIYLGTSIDTIKLISFLESIPNDLVFNIIGNIDEVMNANELFIFFNQHASKKNIIYSYTEIRFINPSLMSNCLYKIQVCFPVDMQKWNKTMQLVLNQPLPVEYIFEVTSVEEYDQAEELIEQFAIEKYQLKPVYTGSNLGFFEEYIFLTKEDILSTSLSIKDLFIRQSINISDFGKINIMPNGDVHSNIHHPILGSIYKHSIAEIIQKEIDEGVSWLRVRDNAPCNSCVYQWLCPSPSDYEITLGRPNLCHVVRN